MSLSLHHHQQALDDSVVLLDYQTFVGYLGGDTELADELLDVFVSTGDSVLNEIEEAYNTGSEEDLKRLAHGFKGACANIHAPGCRQAALQLEEAVHANNVSATAQSINGLKQAYNEVKHHIASLKA